MRPGHHTSQTPHLANVQRRLSWLGAGVAVAHRLRVATSVAAAPGQAGRAPIDMSLSTCGVGGVHRPQATLRWDSGELCAVVLRCLCAVGWLGRLRAVSGRGMAVCSDAGLGLACTRLQACSWRRFDPAVLGRRVSWVSEQPNAPGARRPQSCSCAGTVHPAVREASCSEGAARLGSLRWRRRCCLARPSVAGRGCERSLVTQKLVRCRLCSRLVQAAATQVGLHTRRVLYCLTAAAG